MRNIKLILILLMASLAFPSVVAAQTVILKTDTITVACAPSNDTILVPVRVENFTDIGSMQFTLSWDTTKLDFLYNTQLGLPFQGFGVNFGFDNTSFINQNPAKLTFNWTKFGGGSVPNGTVVFSLAFKRIGGAFAAIQFTSTPVAIEITDKNGDELLHQTISGGVNPTDNIGPAISCPANVMMMASTPVPVNNIAPESVTDNCSVDHVGWASSGATIASFPTDPDASGSTFTFGTSTVTYTVSDVGSNTATCSFTITIEPSNTSDTLTIIAQSGTASCGQPLAINISAINFDSLGSLQFTLVWDPATIQYTSVGNFNPALNLAPNNFGISSVSTGSITFAWTTNSASGTTVPQGATLFTLNFNAIGNSGGASSLNFSDNPTVREAYTSATAFPEEIPAIWVNGLATIQDVTPPAITCPQNTLVDAPIGTTSVPVSGLDPQSLTDNCTGNISLTYTQAGTTNGTGSGPANGSYYAGTTTVTYTAADGAGNTSTCSFLVVVDAGTPVTLMLDTVATDCQGAGSLVAVNLTVKDFNDIVGLQFSVNWDETVLQFVSVTNEFPGLGLTPANYNGFANTASGLLQFLGGNAVSGWPAIPDNGTFFTINFIVLNPNSTADITFTGPFDAANSNLDPVPINPVNGYFHSEDLSGPTLTCPADQTVDAGVGTCDATVMLDATATDACSGVQGITQQPVSNVFNSGNTVVTFTATDNAGNTATCSTTVTVNAVTEPTIVNCPIAIVVYAPPSGCQQTATWALPSGIAACTGASLPVMANHNPGDPFNIGTTTVNYTTTDGNGSTAGCAFTVTVKDTIAPVITCPADLTLSTIGNLCCVPGNYTIPSGTDNCDAVLDLTSTHTPDENFCVGVTLIEYYASDDFGNVGGCSFNITVEDNTPPVLDGCPADTVISTAANMCGANYTWVAPTADDLCDNNTLVVTGTQTPGSFFNVGTTTVTYTTSDNSGNTATCSFSITVEDQVPPVISGGCPPAILVDLPVNRCDTILSWTPPQATDNCTVESITANIAPNSLFPAGRDTVIYTVTDLSGNTATCSFIVQVKDKVAPVISGCPSSAITVASQSSCKVPVNWTPPTATDNCSIPTLTSAFMPGDSFAVGMHMFLIIAADASGNYDTCKVTINVTGTPPGFTGIPANINISGCTDTVTWIPPVPVGICNVDTVYSNHQPGEVFPQGTTVVIYTAVDQDGSTTTASFTITITDNVPPQVTCPESPIIVNVAGQIIADPDDFLTSTDTVAGCSVVQLNFGQPSAVDNCITVNVAQTLGLLSGAAFPIGTDTLVFVATDASNNSAVCAVEISVVDLADLRPSASPNPACAGAFVVLKADSIAGASYFWSGPKQGYPNTNQITIAGLDQSTAGIYTVYAVVNGCTTGVDTIELLLPVDPNANDDLSFSIDPLTTDTFPSVFLNDIISPLSDFEITSVSQLNGLIMNPDGTFIYTSGADPGNISFFYEVCSKSCPDLCDMATVTILVNDNKCSFVPNIFSPNSDGSNDYFVIPCIDSGFSENNSLVIYNQWGDKVFEASPYSNDPASAWNGTLNNELGKDLPDGVYFYIFKPSPNEATIKGFVEIFR